MNNTNNAAVGRIQPTNRVNKTITTTTAITKRQKNPTTGKITHEELVPMKFFADIGPPYLTIEVLSNRPTPLYLKVDFMIESPRKDRLLYPSLSAHTNTSTTPIDTTTRIFDIHCLHLSDTLPWTIEDSSRLELHIDSEMISLYSYHQALIYRTRQHISGLKADISPTTGLPLSKPISDQIQLFSIHSNTNVTDASVTSNQLHDWAAYAPLPLGIYLSLRDLRSIWFDKSSNIMLQLTFYSGFTLEFLVKDALEVVQCLLQRLSYLHIFITDQDERIIHQMLTLTKELAAKTREQLQYIAKTYTLEQIKSHHYSPYHFQNFYDFIQHVIEEQKPLVKPIRPMQKALELGVAKMDVLTVTSGSGSGGGGGENISRSTNLGRSGNLQRSGNFNQSNTRPALSMRSNATMLSTTQTQRTDRGKTTPTSSQFMPTIMTIPIPTTPKTSMTTDINDSTDIKMTTPTNFRTFSTMTTPTKLRNVKDKTTFR